MQWKHILIIASSSVLLGAAGSALAVEDATSSGYPQDDATPDASSMQTTQEQSATSDDSANESANNTMTDNAGSSSDTATALQSESTSTNNATYNSARQQNDSTAATENTAAAQQDSRNIEIVRAIVDDAGRLRGYIVRVGDAGNTKQYVISPQEKNRPSDTSSAMTTTQSSNMGNNATSSDMTQQQTLAQLHRQLQKQALEIRLLKMQLAAMASGGSSHMASSQAGRTQPGPLGQVAHVIVDPQGRVQAVVLDSGIVLASDKWANAVQGMFDGQARAAQASSPMTNTLGSQPSELRRRAIIIFKPGQ